MIYILTLIFIVYTCFDAITQAYYYGSNPSKTNIHYLFVIQRAILVGSLSFNLPFNYDYIKIGVFAFALCCIYSFIHNGVYYMARGKKVYPKGFWSSSDTSTALMEFGVGFRTAMFIVGLIFVWGLTLK
jgi:hypothetical protein